MKKLCVLLVCLVCFGWTFSNAQLLNINLDFPTESSSITVTVDATKGNKGLTGFAGTVYLHTGVITSASRNQNDWKYVKGTWGTTTAPVATSAGTNKWSFTINNPRAYYGVPAGEKIEYITILFRNQAGNSVQRNEDGTDMYIKIYEQGAFAAKFIEPAMQPTFIPIPERISNTLTSLNVKVATSQNANTTIQFNNQQIGQSSNSQSATGTANIVTECEQVITYTSNSGGKALKDTLSFFKNPAVYPTGARPANLKDGITFENNNTEAVFILYAPLKNKVHLVGDFSNWNQTCDGLMKREGTDPKNYYYWVRIGGLTPGKQYRFQYIVDDTIRFADPYSTLVLDPWNDKWIPKTTYPNMPEYPVGLTPGDYVGVFTPGEAEFQWTDVNYVRPNKYNLMIYELHMRDFLKSENWKSLIDTLPYLVNLGFNAIKLMPINEFDGNDSWGYNPCYYFAPDKAYGSKESLKQFINEAHRNGIAIIMDIAFNQATGQSPLAKMWWNSGASKPASNSPYFYTDAKHPFNVYNDFNHNSNATKYHVERFIDHWLKEYKIDGFRWDLSKGFTPANYSCAPDDVGCWGNFNLGRINIWQNYYNVMQNASSNSYCILEHLAVDAEEYELAARGMLLWGKMTDQFNENTMGGAGNKAVDRAYWRNRWNDNFINDKPGLIAYAESHDEERIMYKNRNFGSYRDLPTALARTEAMAAVLMGIPGPKMIWQFGELGYDVSITACADSLFQNWTVPQPYPDMKCRTGRKPIRWNYFYDGSNENAGRRKLYNLYASMAKLRKAYPDAFNRTTLSSNGTFLGNDLWKTVVVDHSSLKMVVVANFKGTQENPNLDFPDNGTWYDYINGGTISVSNNKATVTIPASSYRVYINKNFSPTTSVRELTPNRSSFPISVYPNPVTSVSVIKYELPRSGKVNLRLMSLQGQLIASKNLGYQLNGTQFFSLDDKDFKVKNLQSGTYLLQISVDNKISTERIIIQ